MANMTAMRVLLDLATADSISGARFISDDADHTFHMSWETFDDMGSPAQITVTVEPGDLLNEEN